MKKGFIPVLIVLFVVVLGIGGYFVYSSLRVSPKADVAISPSTNPTATTLSPSSTNETANWKVKSSSTSPDGLKTLAIKTAGMADSFIKVLVISNKDGTNEQILISQKGIDSNSWVDVTESNWSMDSRFVYLHNILLDGGDVYVFNVNGEKFSTNKNYLLASELGYNSFPLGGFTWVSPSQLQFEGGVALVIQPKTIHTYILDLSKEELRQIK